MAEGLEERELFGGVDSARMWPLDGGTWDSVRMPPWPLLRMRSWRRRTALLRLLISRCWIQSSWLHWVMEFISICWVCIKCWNMSGSGGGAGAELGVCGGRRFA
uniref:(northern house mosquito) hypothetical protein n=1 Tax=Culex pipiens TaxID=7175 RepID=A0A8D8FK31_CULPI